MKRINLIHLLSYLLIYKIKRLLKGVNQLSEFTHINKQGRAKMVDISGKGVTERTARAQSSIIVTKKIYEAVTSQNVKKGRCLVRRTSSRDYGSEKYGSNDPNVPSSSITRC